MLYSITSSVLPSGRESKRRKDASMDRAIFLDRDGVINEIVYHQDIGVIDTPFTPQQFQLLPGVAEAIRLINQTNFKAIVVSNQPGIAKNHFTEEILEQIDQKMRKELAKEGAFFDGIYYCLHHPDGSNGKYRKVCECRKPKPGLLLQAAGDLNIDLTQSYVIGDSITDVLAGQRAGCKTLLIGRMKCDLCRLMDREGASPDLIVAGLLEAIKVIERREAIGGNLYRFG